MSVLTLAIGIGASALMLSVVSTILLKPLPYGDPDRIEMLCGSYPHANFAVPRGSEMPGDFQFAAMPELWVPLKPPQEGIADLAIVGRLRAGTTHFAARQDMDRVMAVVERSIPVVKNSHPRALLVPLRHQITGDITTMLMSLIGGRALVLLIAVVK